MSILTTTLMPARSSGSPGARSTFTRSGMRCTTFTQLPEAFCAGSTENSAPLAGEMLSTVPRQTRPG